MKKLSLLILVGLMVVSVCFGTECQGECECEKYLEILTKEAEENIKNLPPAKAASYRNMLEEHNDVIMAFILAKEEGSKLLLVDEETLLSHYKEIIKLRQQLKDEYSIPFFLSYIAKITVTEERITPYRELFRANGLYELPRKYPDLYELVREVNLWARKYMTFQSTSGRDMAPVDIINKTNIGRCEEMMIFFISAARSVGIPARPASTPYWAHIDNNHAWVEVFVNGKWHHTGAAEPTYRVNEAWFSESAAKAVMITATAAFPDSSDIVIGKRGYISVINSTPCYDSDEIKARKIIVETKDAEGKTLAGCKIAVQVFNWGTIRPILQVKADENGRAELVVGNGSFFVSASKDNLYALQEVASDVDSLLVELVLKPVEELTSLYAKLEYRDKKVNRLPASDDWENKVKGITEEYNKIVAAYQEEKLPFEEADSLLLEVWQTTRNNKKNFAAFYELRRPERELLRYLTKLDPKLLWQGEVSQFDNLYLNYQLIKDSDYSDEVKLILLSPTQYYEEPQQKIFPKKLTRWRKGKNRLEKVITYLEKNYKIDEDKAVKSFQMPADVLASLKYLNSYQYKILTCAVLNANHIPARYTYLPNVLALYSDGKGRYYDIIKKEYLSSEKEEKERHLMSITLIDEESYPISIGEQQVALTFLRDGLFYTNETQPKRNEAGLLEAELEPGNYQLQLGYRPNNNVTHVHLESINVVDKEIRETITLYEYPRKWEILLPELEELMESVLTGIEDNDNFALFLFGNHDKELAKRLSDRLVDQADTGSYIWLGTGHSPDAAAHYKASERFGDWLKKYPQYKERTITIFRDKEAKLTYFDGMWGTLPQKYRE